MARGFLVIVGITLLSGACTQRMICPAYQSSFIYDQETLKKKFSYFQEDSTPKVLTASKSKYLIAVPESYRKKYRRLQTVEMKPVYPVIPDSLKVEEGADIILAEADVQDSAAVEKRKIEPGDSAYAITKTKEKYNLDQDLYMWYFRDVLVLPDVRAAMQKKDNEASGGGAKATKKKKGIKGFFANLFKKKQKPDSLNVPPPPPAEETDSFDFEQNDSTQVKPVATPPQKKGLGGLFGKKKKAQKAPEQPPAKKEEDK